MPASPYWKTRVPTLQDVRNRVKDILLGVSFDPDNPDYTPTSTAINARNNFANGCKVVSAFEFVKEALSKTPVPDNDKTDVRPEFEAMHAFVMKQSTVVVKDKNNADLNNYAMEAEDKFSVFVAYPIRTQSRGAISAYILDDTSHRLMAGFNGACFGRSYPAYAKGIEWYSVDADWAVMEVMVCVPYTVGSMDNPNIQVPTEVVDVDLRAGIAGAQSPSRRYATTIIANEKPPNPTQYDADSTWHSTDDFVPTLRDDQKVWVLTVFRTVYPDGGVAFTAPVVHRQAGG